MGYDMYCRGDHPEYAEAGDRFMRTTGNTPEAREALATLERIEREGAYFRLNVWGMGKAREMMDRFGMLHWADHPPWPSNDHLTNDDWENETPAYLAYDEACNEVRGFVAEMPGIAGVKFGSNDFWWVRPGEIEDALRIYDTLPELERRDARGAAEWWDSWVEWLRHVGAHGGAEIR